MVNIMTRLRYGHRAVATTSPQEVCLYYRYGQGRQVDNKNRENVFYMHLKARSSGGERYLDTVEVPGSKPGGPTIFFPQKTPPHFLLLHNRLVRSA